MNTKTRCTNKSLMQGAIPPGGTTPADQINASLQIVDDTNTTSGSINLTYPLANDQLQIGNYYDMTLVDGIAPVKAETKRA